MSGSGPSPATINLEQQHKRAKDLLRQARAGDAAALVRIRLVRADAGDSRPPMLADAQLAVAREAGFASWPMLVAAVEARDIAAFRDAVHAGDVSRTRQLLGTTHVRDRVNEPMFAFGQRAAHMAATNRPLLDVLLDAGADVGLKSDWENGPFTVLDNADEANVRHLLTRGALLTPHVAARLGWLAELQVLVEADGALVHARGGDGRQPLHEARTVAVADFLLDSGAGIDVPCIDHHSTPAQYALADRPDVCRRLLERGATPDVFMAARLGDAALAMRVVDADASAVAARINEPGYAPVPPMHIYCWTLGFGLSPHGVALKFGHRAVADLLLERSPEPVRFVHAVQQGDEAGAAAILAVDPMLVASLPRRLHAHLAFAIFHGDVAAASLMLRLGLDPAEPGMDGGSALHAACWIGHVGLVEQILAKAAVPVDARDSTHGSTPLGWASFGAVHRRAPGSDYSTVIDRLVAAGADTSAAGNRNGHTLLQMAEGRPDVQATLRRHGAV